MNETYSQILNIEEASEYLRVPLSSLYKLAQAGRVPCQKVGRHWRFRKESIDKWLDEKNNPSQELRNISEDIDAS